MSGWAWVVIVILVALLVIQSWYYIELTWARNRRYQQQVRELNDEYRIQTEMMKRLTLPQVMNQGDKQ